MFYHWENAIMAITSSQNALDYHTMVKYVSVLILNAQMHCLRLEIIKQCILKAS